MYLLLIITTSRMSIQVVEKEVTLLRWPCWMLPRQVENMLLNVVDGPLGSPLRIYMYIPRFEHRFEDLR